MAKLTITKVLLNYEVPLVVVATDGKDKKYIGINYSDGEESHLFYFARVRPTDLDELFQQRIDVRYLVTKLKRGKYEFGETWGETGEVVKTTSATDVVPEALPKPGMFIPQSIAPTSASTLKAIHIDGRWGINDLRRFSDLVQDCYAFVYALSGTGSGSAKQQISGLFHRYPWRGGFSSVNFFDDLYKLIPSDERADIKKIQYASPGTIELRMNGSVADSIRVIVEEINSASTSTEDAYSNVHDWLRDKGWLGKATDDLVLTASDNEDLKEKLRVLCSALGLSGRVNEIFALASSDSLGAVKILLAYYRRLAGLADYVATGKAQELFTDA